MKKTIAALLCLIAGITATRAAVASNTVEVVYNGTTATVNVAANISQYITDNSAGTSHVRLVQSDAVSDAVGEITYILSGTSTDGEFYLEGSYKLTVELNGLTLTNPAGPAVNLQDGKRIKVKLTEGTVSTLTDGLNDTYNGCLHAKGHTEFRGKGVLNVQGNAKHAIYSKEYVQLKNATINILGAVKDGLHCKEYFYMESGAVNISAAGDDGIQVEYENDEAVTGVTADHEDENSGNFYQEGGTLTVSGYGGKAVKADGTISLTGGSRNFTTADVEQTAAIGNVTAALAATEACYDLQGRAATPGRRGLYIVRRGGTAVKRYVK